MYKARQRPHAAPRPPIAGRLTARPARRAPIRARRSRGTPLSFGLRALGPRSCRSRPDKGPGRRRGRSAAAAGGGGGGRRLARKRRWKRGPGLSLGLSRGPRAWCNPYRGLRGPWGLPAGCLGRAGLTGLSPARAWWRLPS